MVHILFSRTQHAMIKKHYSTIVVVWLMSCLIAPLADAKTNVVTSTPGLASLVKEVGGDHVSITSLAHYKQDPHFVDGRPSFLLKLNRADLVIYIGLGLEIGWLPPLIRDSRNAAIQAGKIGNLNASTICGPLLDKSTGKADRKFGDIHPQGNPHYLYAPWYALRTVENIAQRLSLIDPKNKRNYHDNLKRFRQALKAKVSHWEKTMSQYKGKPIVGYHKSLIYLVDWLGLNQVGFIEPLAGISPTPKHLARLATHMKQNNVRIIMSEPWYDSKVAQVFAETVNALLISLPGDVGSENTATYLGWINHLINQLDVGFKKVYHSEER